MEKGPLGDLSSLILDLFIQQIEQNLVAGMPAQGIEIAVMFDPAFLGQSVSHGALERLDGLFGPSGKRLNAGDVVKDHRFIWIDRQSAVGPFEPLLAFPQGDQPVRTHVERSRVIGADFEPGFRDLNAANSGGIRFLTTSEIFVDLAHEQRRLVVVRIDLRGLFVQFDRLLGLPLGKGDPRIEVVGLVEPGIVSDGGQEGVLGLVVLTFE